jgi:hypothetical protein
MDLTLGPLVALLVATSFAAGLNLYITAAMLGMLGRLNLLALPPSLAALQDSWIIGACIALLIIEFVADKMPVLDVIWNALHTFIRPPVAALLAYQTTTQLSLRAQVLCAIAGGLIAFAASAGKTTLRAAVTPSPEPASNIALSLGEDVSAVFLTWLATQHPYLAAAIALCAVVLVVVLIGFAIRAMRTLFGRAQDVIKGSVSPSH